MKWFAYNQSLVRRGEILLSFDVINNWNTELKEMNKDKVEEEDHFHYPNTFLLLLAYAKVYFHLPYRQTKEGIAKGHVHGKVISIFDYITISRRINRLDIKIDGVSSNKKLKNDYIIIAIDIQELRLRIEGQWMRDK
ncbi:MAG: transposase [Candidatus Nitrosocosmicus sp.]